MKIEDDGKIFVTFVVINKTNPSTEKKDIHTGLWIRVIIRLDTKSKSEWSKER